VEGEKKHVLFVDVRPSWTIHNENEWTVPHYHSL